MNPEFHRRVPPRKNRLPRISGTAGFEPATPCAEGVFRSAAKCPYFQLLTLQADPSICVEARGPFLNPEALHSYKNDYTGRFPRVTLYGPWDVSGLIHHNRQKLSRNLPAGHHSIGRITSAPGDALSCASIHKHTTKPQADCGESNRQFSHLRHVTQYISETTWRAQTQDKDGGASSANQGIKRRGLRRAAATAQYTF